MTQLSDEAGSHPHGAERGFTAWVGHALASMALLSFRRPLLALFAVLAVTGLASWAALGLRVDPDISELLPSHYESVRDLETLKRRFGGVGYVVVLLEGGTADERRTLARSLEPELARLETVSYVELEKPAAYLAKRALWLLPLEDLRTLEQRIRARYHHEIDRRFLDLDDSPPPEVETSDLLERLRARFGALGNRATVGDSPYFEDAERLAIFVRPRQLASNLEFAKGVVGDVERVVAASAGARAATGVKVELTGRYKKRVDLQRVLARDLGRTSLLSIVLIAAYLALHFRRPTAVLLLLVPLNVGLVLTYGLASLAFGTLNILTAFLGAILVGIGVDSGIHVLGRVHEETSAGAPLERAVALAFRDAGRVSLAATLTTAAAFLCLTSTDFRAFREFGSLTAAGVLLVFFSYVALLPAMLRLGSRLRLTRPSAHRARLWGTGWLQRAARVLVPVLGLVVLGLAGLGPRVAFDADISRLDDADLPSFKLDRDVTALLGRSQTPLVAFTASSDDARAAAELVRDRMRKAGDEASIGEVATLSDILPGDLGAREPLIASIRRMLSHLGDGALKTELAAKIPDLDEVVHALPPTRDELPVSIRQILAPSSDPEAGPLVLLYPRVSLGEADAVLSMDEQVRHLTLPSGAVVRTSGEPMVLADILRLIGKDGPRILVLTLLLVVVFLRLTLGSMRLALLATVPAVLTLFVTAGLLFSLGIHFNLINMIILPVLLGIGVDDGAHFVARLEAGEPLSVVWSHTGVDVAAAILTDALGFGVLALAAHPGLASLGIVALVGLGVNFVLCVLLLPLVLSVSSLVRSTSGRSLDFRGCSRWVKGTNRWKQSTPDSPRSRACFSRRA